MNSIGISGDFLMDIGLIFLILIFLFIIGVLSFLLLRERAEHRHRGLFGPWPIRKISPADLDPIFDKGPHGPSLASEVVFLGRGTLHVPGGTTDSETWILATLAKNARCAFEFGTCTGKTAYLWARNMPADGQVITLTLSPTEMKDYHPASGDAAAALEAAREESVFNNFLYNGTIVETKIVQLYGDSKAFDETPYRDRCDLIFIDGSHAYSYVKSDTQKALRMARPGGIILWHDYRGARRAPDVFRYLNTLAQQLPLMHIAGTSLVAYRVPTTKLSSSVP
ncbi:MAG: class I SAM-dependent methyltransferase [Alphaproteobacteria bacterium]